MLKACLALIVFVAGAAQAQELALKRRFEYRFDKPGWSVFTHGSKLVAFNRESLQVEILDAVRGEQTASDSLDSQEFRPVKVDTLSTSRGEFLIALAGRDHMVEWHSVTSESAYEVHIDSDPIALKLIEGRGGEVYMVVATRSEVAVYRRAGEVLEVVRALTAPGGYKQVQAMRSNTGLVVLSLYDSKNRVRVVQLDVAGGAHEDISVVRLSSRVEATVDMQSNDFMTALVGPRAVRFYLEGQPRDTVAVSAAPELGAMQWLKGSDGRPLFATASRSAHGVGQLVIYDPRNLAAPVRLGIGDARSITDIGSFSMRGKVYFYYVRDHKFLYIQNENEVSAVPARVNERIAGVMLVKAASGLAIVLESSRGTRVQMVGAG
jgi:hypothetical protein